MCYIVHIQIVLKAFVIIVAYIERLNLINLNSLRKRREVADIIFLHGLLNNTIQSPSLTSYISFDDVCRSLRNTNTLYVKNVNGKHTPVSRMCRLANNTTFFKLLSLKLLLFFQLVLNLYLNVFFTYNVYSKLAISLI